MGSDLRWAALGVLYDPVGGAPMGLSSGFDVGPAASRWAAKASGARDSSAADDPAGCFEAFFRHRTGIRAALNDPGAQAARRACLSRGVATAPAGAVLRAWMCAVLARREDDLGVLRDPETREVDIERLGAFQELAGKLRRECVLALQGERADAAVDFAGFQWLAKRAPPRLRITMVRAAGDRQSCDSRSTPCH